MTELVRPEMASPNCRLSASTPAKSQRYGSNYGDQNYPQNSRELMRVVFADFEAFSNYTIRPKSYAVTVHSKPFPVDVFGDFQAVLVTIFRVNETRYRINPLPSQKIRYIRRFLRCLASLSARKSAVGHQSVSTWISQHINARAWPGAADHSLFHRCVPGLSLIHI